MEESVAVPTGASGLGWLRDGRMVVVSMADYSRLLAFKDGVPEIYADLGISRGTPNDMVVDEYGRAYVGNAGCNLFAGIDPKPTNLIMVEDGRAREVADDLIFPNGMAISPGGSTLIVAETFAHRLTAFDINPRDGSLSGAACLRISGIEHPTVFVWMPRARFGRGRRKQANSFECARVGEVTNVINTSGRFATACVTGGADRRSLYMITAHFTPELFAKKETTARIELADLEIPGAGIP